MKPKLIWYQFKVLLPGYVITLSLLSVLVIVVLRTEIPMSYFTRDPVAIMGAPSYLGLLSNIGILLWCSSAAVCLLSFAVLRKRTNNRELPLFFLFSGIITSILLLDDLFLFHEEISLYIPEIIVFMGYGIITSLHFIRFRTIVLRTEYLLLLFAYGFFGVSIVTDVGLIPISGGLLFLIEDGSKLLGIVSWFTYFVRVCWKEIGSSVPTSLP